MSKVSSIQQARDNKNLESFPFELKMPVCGQIVYVTGRYCEFYGRINSFHVDMVVIPTEEWQDICKIQDRIQEYLEQWFFCEIGEEYD